ncbi:MAG: FAD-dependent oxidoreductase [Planctomycetes bacterium]|nr:FAD-dependent oxidoreductase [Planctomycetota bacterium]
MNVTVIGGVAAGMSAAAKLKRNLRDGVTVTVFEKGDHVSYGACGIPFFVAGHIENAAALVERTPEDFSQHGIDVRIRHEVTAVDLPGKTVTVCDTASGTTFRHHYDKLIVASGARVRKIPPLDVERENLFVVREVADGVRLREHLLRTETRDVVVVGAGYIGLEIAEACAAQGKTVHLVEFADRVLPAMDPEITDRLETELSANGVRVHTDCKVVELEGDDRRITGAVVEGRDGRWTIPADAVINCAGIVPNADFIAVRKAANGAITVNDRMETSAPDVYAAGDCSVMTSFLTGEHAYTPLGTTANKQGRLIAEIIAGKTVPPFRLIGSSALRLFSLDAAKVGLSELDAQRLNLDYGTNAITGNSYASYYAPGQVFIKLVYDNKSRRILGAQLVGEGVVAARANYYAIAMTASMTVDEFGYLDLAYSPPFSGVWDATLIAANTAK